MADYYCAKCGKRITTLHIVIPGTGLRYHRACKPENIPVEITVKIDGKVFE